MFRQHYGPNNAVLVLAGEHRREDGATIGGEVVRQHSGGAEAGQADGQHPDARRAQVRSNEGSCRDHRLYRTWAVPGIDNPDTVGLRVGAHVLGGLSSSRLDNALVRDEKLAVAVSAYYSEGAQLGWVNVSADVRPGVDPAVAAKPSRSADRGFCKDRPTEDGGPPCGDAIPVCDIAGLEQVGDNSGKAVKLAEGELYLDDSKAFKKELNALATIKPAEVTRAMQTWLTRPVYALTVEPGERQAYEEAVAAPAAPASAEPLPAPKMRRPRSARLPISTSRIFQRAKLSNGIPVIYVRRNAVPMTQIS